MARTRYTVSLEGGAEIKAALGKLEKGFSGPMLLLAVERGAEITRDVASQLAPRSVSGSHGRAPGFLSSNIVAEKLVSKPKFAQVGVGPSKAAFYGRFRELGTIFQGPEPFLRPAFDETRESVVAEIGASLRKMIELLTANRGM
jgi:HK97 gp10 family phage protein